ncbi:MAG: hypothetical protein NT069_16195 [Planctomycetota bacterium]|nr:hypothetical protein [Planctomycetota bacterium]
MNKQLLAFALTLCAALPLVAAEVPRALPAGTLPSDSRLQPPKDLNGYFPFNPPDTKAEWDQRADYVRRLRPSSDSGVAGTVAHADQVTSERGDSWQDRTGRVHG